MRDRLTELICENIQTDECVAHCNHPYCDKCKNLADYLLENGVIVPPCKVGDTVYRVIEMGTGIHFKQVGRCGIGHSQGYKIVPCEEKIKRFIRTVEVSKNNFFDICENFGKTVFLTREEAEAKLEGEQ